MPHVISTANDLSIALAPVAHDGVLLPGPLPTAEAPAPMRWAPGASAGRHRFAERVQHRGAPVVQQGHDLGPGIVHVTTPPDLAATAVHTLASRRSVVHGFASVRVCGVAVGIATASGTPPTPMECCADPTGVPVGDAPTSHLNSVVVGSEPSARQR